MKITTVDTNRTYEVTDEPLEVGFPYVFSADEGKTWHYCQQYRFFPSEGGKNMYEIMNPGIIRKAIKQDSLYL
jgi:hypothetical protein